MRPTVDQVLATIAGRHGVCPARLKAGAPLSQFERRVRATAIAEVRANYPTLRNKTIGAMFGVSEGAVSGCRHVTPVAPQPDPHDVLRDFAATRKAALRDIIGRDQYPEMRALRLDAMREVARRCPQLSTPEIGRVFGRHHVTVLNALGRLARQRRD